MRAKIDRSWYLFTSESEPLAATKLAARRKRRLLRDASDWQQLDDAGHGG